MGLLSGIKKLGAKVDPTSKNSAVRKTLRNVDSAVGGGSGWSKLGIIAGSVAAAPFTGGSSLAVGLAGGAKFASDRVAQEKQETSIKKAKVAADAQRAAMIETQKAAAASMDAKKPIIILAVVGLAAFLLMRKG